MLTAVQEHFLPTGIDVGSTVRALTFSANGEYLVSGDGNGVRVWRVENGEQVANMKTGTVNCLAASKDWKWIAAGTNNGEVFVWNTTTFKQVLKHKEDMFTFDLLPRDKYIRGVDFSPDSSRLLSASGGLFQESGKAAVWDLATGKQIQTLWHESLVIAVKYSPQGDRIATATDRSVRVWDSKSGRFLVDIKVKLTRHLNNGLLWFNDHLFVVSDDKIKELDASAGSIVSEWPVHDDNYHSCIALPKFGEFIAYSTDHTVTFWDTSTHSQLALIQHPQAIHSIALSPDDRSLAIGGKRGKISIESIVRITVGSVSWGCRISEQFSV